jgi:hypothetical protein
MAGSLDGLAWHGLIRITPNFVTKSSNFEAKPLSKARSKAPLRPYASQNNLFLPIRRVGIGELDRNSTATRPQLDRNSTATRPQLDRNSTATRPQLDRNSTETRPQLDRNSTATRPHRKFSNKSNSTATRPQLDRNSTATRPQDGL